MSENEFGNLIYIRDLVVPDVLPIIYGYIRTLEPRKILVIGNDRNSNKKVIKNIINLRYKRASKSVLGRNLTTSGPASVYIIDVLATQSRICKEVRELFKDPKKVVICSIRFPTDLMPESRKLVDEVIVNEETPSSKFTSKLDLCYSRSQKAASV